MIVSSTVKTKRYDRPPDEGKVQIQFAIPTDGGNSSHGDKFGREEKAVRLAWWNPAGGFDPISSAELPEWAMLDVIEACAANSFFSPQNAASLIKALADSIQTQTASAQ